MAVFLINVCKFNGCERIFPSLTDLIHHIENTHIDDSQAPDVTEKTQPTCLPLSYVLRFVTDENRRDGSVAAPVAATAAVASSTNSPDKAKMVAGTSNGLRLSGSALSQQPSSSINQSVAATDATAANALHAAATATHCSTLGANGGNGGSNAGGAGLANNVGTVSNGGPSIAEQNGIGSVALSAGGPEPAKAAQHLSQTVGTTDLKRKIAIKHHSYSISATNRCITPTGSEMDDDEMMVSESEDSNDSWTTEEFSSEFIMRFGSRRHSATGNGSGASSTNEKPFACPVPGCKKRYKNVNGIKYHSKNGHKKDGNRVRKAFKCYCGKSYKTAQRLKNHNAVVHAATHNGGSAMDGPNATTPIVTAPLASPAALISPPVKSPSLSNGPNNGVQSITGPSTTINSLSSTSLANNGHNNSSSIVAAAAAAIASSQIGTNANTTNATCTTSPSTLTITQVTTHKVPRALVLTANNGSGTGVSSVNGSNATNTTNITSTPLPVSGSVTPTSVVFPVSSSTTPTSTGVSPVSIKYDNLGILTPATSPKLIAATLCQDGGNNQPQPAPPIVTTTTPGNNASSVLGGMSLKSVMQASSNGNGAAGSTVIGNGTGELGGSGNGVAGNVGIALVVSSSTVVGNESKLTGGTGNKSAVLSASVTAGQLFAEET